MTATNLTVRWITIGGCLLVFLLVKIWIIGRESHVTTFKDLEESESQYENRLISVEGFAYTPDAPGSVVSLCERDAWNEGTCGRMVKLDSTCPKFGPNGVPMRIRVHGIFKREREKIKEGVLGSFIEVKRLDMLEQNDYSWTVPPGAPSYLK